MQMGIRREQLASYCEVEETGRSQVGGKTLTPDVGG